MQMMARYAKELGITFTGRLEAQHAIPSELSSLAASLESDARTGRASSAEAYFHNTRPDLCWLRHNYLHFSAFFGVVAGANDPQFTRNETDQARRARTIQDG